MHPAYRYMPPYPQAFPIHGESNQYPYQHFPNKGATSPDVRAEVYEHWPHNIPFSHPNPAEPHSCYNHNYPSGYYSFRPPYSPVQPPPPQMYYHGPYPPHPEPYPAYFAPPPYYSVDPGMAKYHCCGCPNHVCNRSGSSVKIEEHPHESEPGNKDDSNLIRLPNKSPPAIWFPPSYAKSGNDSESSFQLDPNILKGLRQGGETNKRHGDDHERMQFPWPIWWIPGNEKAQNAGKDMKDVDTGASSSEEPPSKFTIVPMKLLEDGRLGQKPETGENMAINQAHPEALSPNKIKSRTIPTHPETVSANKTKTRTIPVVEMKPSIIEKPNKDEHKSVVPDNPASGVKGIPESKPAPAPVKKSSKLPPVCLRVDPLPKKNSGNGGARTPSRPLKEERAHQENKDQLPASHQRKDESSKKNIRVFDMDDKSSEQVVVPVVSSKNSSATTEVKAGKKDAEENNEPQKKEVSPRQECEERKERRRDLTETEAIRIIQSAYRGWEVRRSQPLDKLKKIVSIREQVAKVKAQIEALEGDPKQNELKRRVFISETIMNLLLQLDSIQGLHPSLREIRKSIAKDLVSLQEKLDYLGSQTVAQFDMANVKGNTSEPTSNYASLGISSSPMAEPAPENGDDGAATNPTPVPKESESNQQSHESTIPADGQALEASREHSAELPTPTEAKDGSCGFEESIAPRPEEEENHASEVIIEDAYRTAEVSENASLDVGLQEVQESKETECLVSAASNDECLGDSSSPMAEPAPQSPRVQPVGEDGGITHPSPAVLSESVSDHQRHESMLPVDGQALEASCEHSIEPSPLMEADDSRESRPMEEYNQASEVIIEDANRTPEVALLTENASPDLDLHELQESNGTRDVETEETKEVILEVQKPSDEQGSNQEEGSPVQVIESEEVPAVVKAEEPEFQDTKEEPMNQLTGERDTKEEECKLLPFMGESSHGEQQTQQTLAIREEKDLSKGQIESEPGEEVARETIGSSYSVNAVLDEGIKDSVDNAVLALEGVSDHPEDETPIAASARESRSEEKKLIEENEKLKAMLENLIEAGKQQLGVISELNERVKGLEKKMPQKKRVKVRRSKLGKGVPLS